MWPLPNLRSREFGGQAYMLQVPRLNMFFKNLYFSSDPPRRVSGIEGPVSAGRIQCNPAQNNTKAQRPLSDSPSIPQEGCGRKENKNLKALKLRNLAARYAFPRVFWLLGFQCISGFSSPVLSQYSVSLSRRHCLTPQHYPP